MINNKQANNCWPIETQTIMSETVRGRPPTSGWDVKIDWPCWADSSYIYSYDRVFIHAFGYLFKWLSTELLECPTLRYDRLKYQRWIVARLPKLCVFESELAFRQRQFSVRELRATVRMDSMIEPFDLPGDDQWERPMKRHTIMQVFEPACVHRNVCLDESLGKVSHHPIVVTWPRSSHDVCWCSPNSLLLSPLVILVKFDTFSSFFFIL